MIFLLSKDWSDWMNPFFKDGCFYRSFYLENKKNKKWKTRSGISFDAKKSIRWFASPAEPNLLSFYYVDLILTSFVILSSY